MVIKPVDKNLGIAVIEKSVYHHLAQLHLSDATTYQPLDSDPLTATIAHINQTLDQLELEGLISATLKKSLTAKGDTTLGAFYVLPKLHKHTLESRPIVSNVTHPTRRISKHMHSVLVQAAESALSYIPNSLALTKDLAPLIATPNTMIITADIKSLYTRIPNDDGVRNVVKSICSDTANKIKPRALGTLLDLTLRNNVFAFGEQFFVQINGTAMGTIMAPTYANVYLKAKEEASLLSATCPHKAKIRLFRRYIDDILVVYENDDSSLPAFMNAMRNAYKPLELTFKIGRTNIVYLDTSLTIADTRIHHQLYQKPLSNKTYIDPSSQHPPHMLSNIIYNDLLRANRLCNEVETRNKHELSIIGKATVAGYPKKSLLALRDKARKKASEKSIASADPKPTVICLTYNGPATSELANTLKQHWSENADADQKLMIAYRTHPNLKKQTVRSKLPRTLPIPP